MFFFKTYVENEAQRLVPDLFLLFKQALHEAEASGQHLSFNEFYYSSTSHALKTNCIKFETIDPDFIEKS